MSGLLASALAVVAISTLLLSVHVAMRTIVAGIRGECAPLRFLDPVARVITGKVESLTIDAEYRQLTKRGAASFE